MVLFPGRQIVVFAALLLAMTGAARAVDISPLADFENSEVLLQRAFITQTGNGNFAQSDQTLTAGITGQYVEITQTGAANQARALQNGDLNRARIVQTGSENLANTTQNGMRNLIDIAQTGDLNSFVALQTGDDNRITGTQPGGAQANFSEIGNNNSIVSNQGPASMVVNVNIVGNGLSVTINPN